MRLAIAAGILFQTLPVSSKSRISGFGDNSKNRRKAQELRLQAQASGRDVSNTQEAVELDSSFKGFLAKFAENHVDEVKSNPVIEERIECDPNSEDADVGILSCGEGKYCIESETSDLGGLCMNEDSGRDLQTYVGFYGPYFCNATFAEYADVDIECDCSRFNSTSGLGYISCTYRNYCFDNSTCANLYLKAYQYGPGNNGESFCYNFFSPYTQEVCYVFSFVGTEGYMVQATINGVVCDSIGNDLNCTEFDCSSTCGMHSGNTCDAATPYLAPILLPDISGTCNPDGPVTDAPAMATTAAPVDMTTTEAPVDMTMTEAPVEMPPAPTPAPVGGGQPPATSAPVADSTESPTEAPTGGGMSLLTQKTAVSLFGLSMGLLAYFTA